MKILLKTISVLTFALIATNCGEKKETDAYGNPVEEKKEATTEATADPLLAKGQELFEGKGTCTACHKPDVKVVGPSIKDIAKIYNSLLSENKKIIADNNNRDIGCQCLR